jgi:hypothetical protein
VEALRSRSEGASKQPAPQKAKLGGLDRAEADISAIKTDLAQLKAEVGAIAAELLIVQKSLSARVDQAEADLARIALEVRAVGQLRAQVSGPKVWKATHSVIVWDFPALFEEFRAKRWALL